MALPPKANGQCFKILCTVIKMCAVWGISQSGLFRQKRFHVLANQRSQHRDSFITMGEGCISGKLVESVHLF
ncbi:hypothetical protein AT251_12680 [Enterovibrio nigricans]|nr:hypothetical protein AT251_12680 [Enterovibrio nigricans]